MKKILLSSLLAVMAVTSANAKIASTDYADGVAASEAAAAEAAANTYTNQKIGDLDATTNGNGVVVTNVTQTDGVVTVTKGNIAYSSLTGTPTVDTAMSDSSTNAVQNKVIKSYVDNAINTVEGEIGDGYQKLSDKLKSSDTSTQVTDANKDTLYPTVGKTQMIADAAQAAAVLAAATDATSKADAAKTAANSYTDQEIGALDATTNGNGVVVTNVTQTDGVVTVTKGNIAYSSLTGTPTVDTAMSDSSTNAVQNKVIKSYVDNAIDTVEGDVSGKVSINQGEANKDKGLIVNASGNLALTDVATDAELATVSGVANNAKTIADGAVAVNTQQGTAISKNTTDIATNTAAIALNTALRVAIENNANKVDGEGAEGTYALTAVVNEQGVSEFKWEKIGR